MFTLHSYSLRLLYRYPAFRGSLSDKFHCYPGLASLISEDWKLISGKDAPKFVVQMRTLSKINNIPAYLRRGDYYDAVDFDDSVCRAYRGLSSEPDTLERYSLILIDEYQDFNALEAGIIEILAERSPILIAGDDDQALYSQLRNASWDHIRLLSESGKYEIFELPFCMRCPKVIVDTVNDVLDKASKLKKLKGRIRKSYKHFPSIKEADSLKYPKIALVEISVQRQGMNFMGRYLVQAIKSIPRDEIEEAARDGYLAALVIAADPYRKQIISHLEEAGYIISMRHESSSRLNRADGLSILKMNPRSNLGWRIVLAADKPLFLQSTIIATAQNETNIVDVIPDEYRKCVLDDVDSYIQPRCVDAVAEVISPANVPSIMITSFESAKGLSAQHVFIAGLHDGELPHNPTSIKDLEICKFVVGLTRTRKKCTLIYTKNSAGKWMKRSTFISWINDSQLEFVKVSAQYWK